MIASVDIETQGLNAQKFIIGCYISEEQPQPRIFHKKEDLWNFLKETANKLQKRNKTLTVYSHNAAYDWYGYADFNEKGIKFFSTTPFIASLTNQKGKDIIHFLDTMNIYAMGLKELGNMIGLQKQEGPEELKQERCNPEKIQELMPKIIEYCIRDTQIVQKSVIMLKNKIKEDDIRINRLYTLNQIAINYMLNSLKQTMKQPKTLFENQELNQTWKTAHPKYMHSAYRGGRCEAFQTGMHKNITILDKRNLYPYSATQITMPDLRTETYIKEPLQYYKIQELVQNPGIITGMLTNTSDPIGAIPVTLGIGNYYPRIGQSMIGTWTTAEIAYALTKGYTAEKITTAIIYKAAEENPFTKIMQGLYLKRKQSKNEWDDYIYKGLMNRAIGKFGQHRTNQEITVDSINEWENYLKKGYEARAYQGYNYLYVKTDIPQKRKPYYTPIIPATITAMSRIIMHQELSKVPLKDLLYTDTDSIVYKGTHEDLFEIGEELGQFKIEDQDEYIQIAGNKWYTTSKKAKASGIRHVIPEDYKSGKLKNLKMYTIKTTNNPKLYGTFYEETKMIAEAQQKYEETMANLKRQKILIDICMNNSTKGVSEYIDQINELD